MRQQGSAASPTKMFYERSASNSLASNNGADDVAEGRQKKTTIMRLSPLLKLENKI